MIDAEILRRLAALDLPKEAFQEVLSIIAGLAADTEKRLAAAATRTRRYRERGGDQIPDELRKQVYARDGHKCVYCGSSENLQCDHVQPVSKGGPTTLENLATACKICNVRKRDRDRKYVARSKEIPRTNGGNVQGDSENSPTPPFFLSSSGEQERKEEALESARPREASRGPKNRKGDRPANGHVEPAKLPAGFVIEFDSPQAKAWERHNGKAFAWGQRGQRTVPTEWPPGHDPPGAGSNGLETHLQEP